MKTYTCLKALPFLFISFYSHTMFAQAFHKGALLLNISEGGTSAKYTTTNISMGTQKCSRETDGVRDPLFIEYGLSNHWGIGLTTGNDLFTVNSGDYYGIHTIENKAVEIKTSELTFDLNYHFYTSKRIDWSVYGSAGTFGVAFKQQYGETTYNYNAKGGILRCGTKLRYYFWKRLGVLAMFSSYSGTATPGPGGSGSELPAYSTRIRGTATEFGLCFRFF